LQDEKEKAEYLEKAKDLPFARYELEPETEAQLKSKMRFEDPMKNMAQRKPKAAVNKREKMPKLKCPFPGPANRYDIEPGHRWDGVDRSNGYEGRLLLKMNEKKANAEFDYKWRTEDM
jgi:pre-mRNA-splicing factor CWC26